ncbi:MAG: DNA polymerase Y family protein [Betaproteobacteria bacterium]|nr:DNA polymerase Y family protein [Betaproteobacteria bacterium]
MLWVALHFHDFGPATLETLAAWTCQFTPKVSLEPPHALVADVHASLRYFGGLDGLLGKLRDGLGELGCAASLAVAGTPRAALWQARAGGKDLDEVPVGLVFSSDLLKAIGVESLEELLRLPREGLARRCGQALVDELDRALGWLPEPREFFSPPARFDAALELPGGGVAHAEGLIFAARRLLLQLEGLLAARHAGVRGFDVELLSLQGRKTEIPIRLASAARSTDRFVRVLREKLAATALREPVESIGVRAGDFVPLAGSSGALFGDARAEGEAWAKLVERLQARLGAGAVHGLATQPDHRPEHAWRAVEQGEWDPREFIQPGARPLWLLAPPRRVPPQEFELLAGPERIECGWWDGDEAKRDYFIARREQSLAWIYREGGEWYLHGLFA